MAFGDSVGVIGPEIGGALSAAASGHHSLFFAGQPLKEMFKLAPFVVRTAARLRQGKPGKGGKRCRKHRRNLSEEPSGPESPPGRVWPTAGSESCVLAGDCPGEA